MTLPDCMIGPSEPCAGYVELQSQLAEARAALDDVVELTLSANAEWYAGFVVNALDRWQKKHAAALKAAREQS